MDRLVNLRDRLPNGGLVSDWLGTAMTAANIGRGIIDDIREGRPGAPIVRGMPDEKKLVYALAEIEQAANELREVLRHYGIEPAGGAYELIRSGRL